MTKSVHKIDRKRQKIDKEGIGNRKDGKHTSRSQEIDHTKKNIVKKIDKQVHKKYSR